MNSKDLTNMFFEKYSGEEILKCIQCGTCSASCPLAESMDYGPRQLFALIREGFIKDALSANTMWLCVSCYNCVVKCPRDISITDHMYSLKKMALKQKLTNRKAKMPLLYKSFSDPLIRFGKISDIFIMPRYSVFHPLDIIKNSFLAIKLAVRKRLEFKINSVSDIERFKKVMAKAEEMEKRL